MSSCLLVVWLLLLQSLATVSCNEGGCIVEHFASAHRCSVAPAVRASPGSVYQHNDLELPLRNISTATIHSHSTATSLLKLASTTITDKKEKRTNYRFEVLQKITTTSSTKRGSDSTGKGAVRLTSAVESLVK